MEWEQTERHLNGRATIPPIGDDYVQIEARHLSGDRMLTLANEWNARRERLAGHPAPWLIGAIFNPTALREVYTLTISIPHSALAQALWIAIGCGVNDFGIEVLGGAASR